MSERRFYQEMCEITGMTLEEYIAFSKEFEKEHGITPLDVWMRLYLESKR